jgi:glycine/D-amino acid oxidase-like deaminating enzyme
MKPLPASCDYIIVGAGFAGAATAWALSRLGPSSGIILEREPSFGVHASGRNAAISRLAETDSLIASLAWRTTAHIRALEASPSEILRTTGGLTLSDSAGIGKLEAAFKVMHSHGIACEMLSAQTARARFDFLRDFRFDEALWCPEEGIVDIHGLLGRYLAIARRDGFRLATNCSVDGLILSGGRVAGVRTNQGEIRAGVVVDAAGAWGGRLGRENDPLPLTPLRRHLFVSGSLDLMGSCDPFAWFTDPALYFRAEGDGLLLSPCDETASPPGTPSTDLAAGELLAEKLAHYAPSLADLSIRRQWACLRTFAPDRRPVIGPDPDLQGLFHVSGLGGFGMSSSAAAGELAASLIAGARPDWMDAAQTAPARLRPMAASINGD